MGNFRTSFETNTTKENQVITSLGSTLHTDKVALDMIRTDLQTDNTEFQTSISSKIEKLQEDLAMENKIMDELPLKIEKLNVMSVKLTYVNQ